MMTAVQIITECERLSIVLTIGETSSALAYDAPLGVMTPELRAQLIAHKADVIQVLYEREERAGLQDAPEWSDASMWHKGISHSAVLILLDKFAPLGLSLVSVTPMRKYERKAHE